MLEILKKQRLCLTTREFETGCFLALSGNRQSNAPQSVARSPTQVPSERGASADPRLPRGPRDQISTRKRALIFPRNEQNLGAAAHATR